MSATAQQRARVEQPGAEAGPAAPPSLITRLRGGTGLDRLWAGCALVAAALMAVAAFLPLWSMTLLAPQYPGGLVLSAYGTRMEGDLREINALNHYVGIAVIRPETLLEMKLFPYAMAALVIGIVVAAFIANRRLLRIPVLLAAWAAPVLMLVDLQWWLYRYGHDLSPDAAIRLEPFTPKVIGTTQVINFHTEAMVDVGFWLMVGAALLLTVGPATIRFVRESWNNTGTAATAAILVVLFGGLVASPSPAIAAGGSAAPSMSIATMLAEAAPGATVLVPAGTYHESLVIDRPVTLVADGPVVIDGGRQGDVVQITASDVTLRGFVVQGSARAVVGEPTGIRVSGHRATLESNLVHDVLYGVILDSSDGHVVRGNDISSVLEFPSERRGHALYLWYTVGNLVTDNVIHHAKDGIFLGFTEDSVIEHNLVTNVRYGLHTMYANDLILRGNRFIDNVAGASLMYSRGLQVIDNEFSGNRSPASGFGLLFKDMDDVLLSGNRIHHNRLGLTSDGSPRTPGAYVTLTGNLIGYNQIAIELFTNASLTLVENSFIGNLQQVESRGGSLENRNTWSVNGRGNYWDDYYGYDATGDGIGDIEYRYLGAFDDLVARAPEVRAYSFTIARTAIDMASRWFPVYQPEPRVVDPYPLMSPTISLVGSQSDSSRLPTLAFGLGLMVVPIALYAFHHVNTRNSIRRWASC